MEAMGSALTSVWSHPDAPDHLVRALTDKIRLLPTEVRPPAGLLQALAIHSGPRFFCNLQQAYGDAHWLQYDDHISQALYMGVSAGADHISRFIRGGRTITRCSLLVASWQRESCIAVNYPHRRSSSKPSPYWCNACGLTSFVGRRKCSWPTPVACLAPYGDIRSPLTSSVNVVHGESCAASTAERPSWEST